MTISLHLLDRLRLTEGDNSDPKRPGAPVLKAYLCTAGRWTIGYGHNLEANPDPKYPPCAETTCTPEQADVWLVADAMLAERAMLRRWPWMADLPPRVYDVCVDLTFNMGAAKLAGFVRFLAALESKNYNAAADELEDSLWFRQVGRRSPPLVAAVRKGV